jgi:hypothetical protein
MPIIVPDPPINQPTVPRNLELQAQRRVTDWFIAWNPIDLELIPQVKVKTGSGSTWDEGPARPTQRMRLIPQAETTEPTRLTDGTERIVDFVLLGSWNAEMEPNDYWLDTLGERYTVLSVSTFNGYEVKGLIEKHGRG